MTKIFKAYIDGGGSFKDNKGKWQKSLYGFWIVKKAEFLVVGLEKHNYKAQIFQSPIAVSNNASEYLGLMSLIKTLPKACICNIYCDSRLVVCQMHGTLAPLTPCRYRINNHNLFRLNREIRDLIKEKNLIIHLRWIPREENKFGRLLERRQRNLQKKKKRWAKKEKINCLQ